MPKSEMFVVMFRSRKFSNHSGCSTGVVAVALVLASSIVFTSLTALAGGGNGGSLNGIPGAVGGAGGTGINGMSGGNGTAGYPTGGGGGSAGGGNGGVGGFTVNDGSTGAAGPGGTVGNPNGGEGGGGWISGGGSGGGGGYNGNGAGAASVANTSVLMGGNGGNGGSAGGGGSVGSSGGGGGAGGFGAIVTGASVSSNSGTISGGNGGNGGFGQSINGISGKGGDGGVGVQLNAPGATLLNTGTVSGGNGGGSPGVNGMEGIGGVGIAGAGITIINSGKIIGGLSGNTLTRALPIAFTGGVNVLELQAGSTIAGNVVAFSRADTLRLGGSTNSSFNVSAITDTITTMACCNGPTPSFDTRYQGFGNFEKTGISTWTLSGGTASTGQWMVNGGTLMAADAQMPNSSFTVNNGAVLAGGNVGLLGSVVVNSGGTLAPGGVTNSLTLTGNYTQMAGSFYQVTVNAAGRSSLLAVNGVATISGGTVQAVATVGSYAPSTTYTVITAAGGVSGTFSGVTSSFAFLKPSLSYDAKNVYLTLATDFALNAPNGNQSSVGSALNAVGGQANGDLLTVLNALAFLSPSQAGTVLASISGQSYAGFSTAMAQNASMFMNNVASQAGSAGSGNRVMLAEACDIACDSTSPALWGAWGGAVGGLGTIGAGQSVGAITYNSGGFAGGLDRRFSDNFLAGVTVGYTTGTQWISGLDGRATSDTVQAGLYGSFTQGAVYLDGLAGYAYSYNQSWRNILIPGLATRTAQGQTSAGQFYGQLETGYRFELGGDAEAYVTPFIRVQGYTATQNAFTETGAGSLDLSVASQTTNSVRSVLGAVVSANMDMGWRGPLAGQLRLGWTHEYASVDRPVTASFAGAPTVPFTTFGVTPQRNGVLLGLSANTDIADATSLYLRYEGNLSGNDAAHALTVGVRMIW
jgi:outer membrane autotransporter protein